MGAWRQALRSKPKGLKEMKKWVKKHQSLRDVWNLPTTVGSFKAYCKVNRIVISERLSHDYVLWFWTKGKKFTRHIGRRRLIDRVLFEERRIREHERAQQH